MSHVTLKGEVKKVIFKKDYFAIMAITTDSGEFVVKGTLLQDPMSLEKVSISLEGKKSYSEKFGDQIDIISYDILEDEMVFFLRNMVKGLTKNAASLISRKYNEETLDKALRESPEELLEIKGVGKKTLENIESAWTEYKDIRELSKLLQQHGISNKKVLNIYLEFGKAARKVIQEDPYKLTEVKGIGFKEADAIALKLGIDLNHSERLKKGLMYAIDSDFNQNGNTLIEQSSLYYQAKNLLDTEDGQFLLGEELFGKAMKWLSEIGDVKFLDDNWLTLSKIYKKETFLKSVFEDHKRQFLPIRLSSDDKLSIKNILGFKADDSQLEAISCTLSDSSIVTVSGYAGTGKSTVAKASIEMLKAQKGLVHDDIACCALSGVASNRIKEATGYNSSTIHSLLGQEDGRFKHNEDNPLSQKLIIMDEASMVNLDLWYALIKAIDFNRTKLIILGDPGQIEPVGLGNIYHDIISHNLLPGRVLQEVHRQDEDAYILTLADQVRKNKVPAGYKSTEGKTDYTFHETDLPDRFNLKRSLPEKEYKERVAQSQERATNSIALDVTNLLTKKINEATSMEDFLVKDYLREVRVLVAMKKGIVGVENLNNVIQSAVQTRVFDGNEKVDILGKTFFKYDSVIHLKNADMPVSGHAKPKARVMNGQIGYIHSVNIEDETINVHYPEEGYFADYSRNEVMKGMVDLSFAMTIHKSQGAQFNNAILPVNWSHAYMMNSKLLYTGITRAKDNLIIYADSKAFEKACQNNEEKTRKTIIDFYQFKEQASRQAYEQEVAMGELAQMAESLRA
ncbi:MAG: AAA family ATPase [Methyloprofundus sp.]|nr:AAA family ATPase [Methyloprofundus sp.]